ncbi:hypothetical protein IIU_06070 [Bacillus cereus VD133]|uniref:Glutamate synthase domain-containing protein n=1 Tax=Bacillus cereus VD133 TaxID=1053233 RepID=A0A9W5PL19_BACCE|nr:hypothetical protein IIU_06070 [Bacillus cereus VD133]
MGRCGNFIEKILNRFLAIGADAINSARGFMMANGCIMALQCNSGQCPSGVATTSPHFQKALDPNEKQWRVMNYIVSMRYSLFALAAAAGVPSPRHLTRDHIVFKDAKGRTIPLSTLFPIISKERTISNSLRGILKSLSKLYLIKNQPHQWLVFYLKIDESTSFKRCISCIKKFVKTSL